MILQRPCCLGSAMGACLTLAFRTHAKHSDLCSIDLMLKELRAACVAALDLIISRHHFLSSISVMRVPGGTP